MDLLALPDDVLARILSQVHDPGALLALALTCKRSQRVVEGAAQAFIERATDEERSNLPRVNLPMVGAEEGVFREWGMISKYQQILMHRGSLQFDQIVGDVEHRGGDKSKLYTKWGSMPFGFGVSNRIMRSGVHNATFRFSDDAYGLFVGIARPMDYYNKKLYQHTRVVDPRDVAGKYPREWQAETKINVVLCRGEFVVELGIGQGRQCRSIINARFTSRPLVRLVLDMDKGTLSLYITGGSWDNHCEIASGLDGEYVWVGRGTQRCDWNAGVSIS